MICSEKVFNMLAWSVCVTLLFKSTVTIATPGIMYFGYWSRRLDSTAMQEMAIIHAFYDYL